MKNKLHITDSRITNQTSWHSKVVRGLRASKLAALAKNL